MSAPAANNAAQNPPQPPEARYHPLVIVAAAAAAGIAADRFAPLPLAGWWCLALAGLLAWLPMWRRRWLVPASLAVLAAVLATAGAWHHCCWHLFRQDDLGLFARAKRQPACVEVVALDTPRTVPSPAPSPMQVLQHDEQCRLDVSLVGIRDRDTWRPASGCARLLVNGLLPDIQPGDRLQVFAELAQPPRPMNPGEFDYDTYLRASRVRARLRADFAEAVSRLEIGRAWNPRRVLERIRTQGKAVLAAYLPERHSALAAAVLLGLREGLDPETTESFMVTGTIHLLVISGMNMALLAGMVLWVLRRMPIGRLAVLAAVAVLTLTYMLLVDAEPPVVRATIVVLVACGSMALGRRWTGPNALGAAGLVVLAINPADLFRIGAQLSFLCLAILLWLVPRCIPRPSSDPIERLIAQNRPWWQRAGQRCAIGTRNLAIVSLVMWLATLPLVMAQFHLFNPVAVLTNTLASLPMAAVQGAGLAVLLLGPVAPPLAAAAAAVCSISLNLLQWAIDLGQRCPGGYFWVPAPADWWLAGVYGALGLAAVFPALRPPRRWCVAAAAGWIALGFGVHWLSADHQKLRCTFLAVGHGAPVVVELPGGQTLLSDPGQLGAPGPASRTIAAYLWQRGRTHIDAVAISHADSDHFNALPELLRQFSVGAVYVSPVMWDHDTAAVRALRRSIDEAGVPIRQLHAGQRLAAGSGCRIEALHPPKKGVLGRDNANSLTLVVEYQDHRILLTGDLESPGLNDLVAESPRHCEVVLVPHHGSRQSDPNLLAPWSTPDWAMLSASDRWDLSAVSAVYEGNGGRVLHTAKTGAITATVGAAGVEVTTFLRD